MLSTGPSTRVRRLPKRVKGRSVRGAGYVQMVSSRRDVDAATEAGHQALDPLGRWSEWVPISEALAVAPRSAGVYVARQGQAGPIVYVGMAGERNGKGIRGRLGVYLSGKALASGLGEAVFDRALADPEWLRDRLDEIDAGETRRAKQWGKAAFDRADLHIRWTTTVDRESALALERQCMEALLDHGLWNRQLPTVPGDEAAIVSALKAVTPEQWLQLDAAISALADSYAPPATWVSPEPSVEVVDDTDQVVGHHGYPQYPGEVTAVVDHLYQAGLIVPFDWQSWATAQPDLRHLTIAEPVAAVKYLTAVVRAERFSEGTIAAAIESGQFAEALRVIQKNSRGLRDTVRMSGPETFQPDLLARIRRVLDEGDIVPTLSHGKPNVIGRINEGGIEVTTEKSAQQGMTRLVPAWMFNHVWTQLLAHGRVDRDFADRLAPGRKVKRSSVVFAILERLPEVSVIQDRPLVLGLDR